MMNKMIYLIAPPRSLSTAFLRMMQARGDFKIFNEPATALFNQTHYPHSSSFYKQQEKESYQGIREHLFQELEQSPVFIKEMSFAFDEFIQQEPALLKNPAVHFAFLVRNPHHCIISYYKKMPPEYIDYMIWQLKDLTAYRPLYQSYQTVLTQAVNKPLVLHAEQLIAQPKQTIQTFCQQVNLPFIEKSLQWESLGEQFDGQKDWQEHKHSEATHHWHREAILSKGFHKPRQYAVDEQQRPLFSEIEHHEHRAICQQVYDEYKEYYQAISESRNVEYERL